jgi:hypothetical protein
LSPVAVTPNRAGAPQRCDFRVLAGRDTRNQAGGTRSAQAVENRIERGPGNRMRLRFLPVLVVAVMLLGACLSLTACGGNEDDGGSPSGQGAEETADSRAIEELAKRYLAALAAEDYREACATRATRDRSALARSAGSCERAFRAILATQAGDRLRDARIGNVKVRGSRASVSLTLPGGHADNDPLLAIKEGDHWGLISEEALNEDRTDGRDAKRQLRGKRPACPTGTDLVRVSDLAGGLPPAYELARVAEEPPVVDVLRVALRGRLRLVETKVLLERGREVGTSLTVLNSRERQSAQSFLADTLEGARAAGAARPRPIEIAGGKGALVSTPGGAFATAQIGTCASVMLTDGNQTRLLRAVSLLSRP